jgi:hypothetical protein
MERMSLTPYRRAIIKPKGIDPRRYEINIDSQAYIM